MKLHVPSGFFVVFFGQGIRGVSHGLPQAKARGEQDQASGGSLVYIVSSVYYVFDNFYQVKIFT